jgi:hypothetical protein
VGGRKIGLERVKDQEERREQENHYVGRGPTLDRKGLMLFPSVAWDREAGTLIPRVGYDVVKGKQSHYRPGQTRMVTGV